MEITKESYNSWKENEVTEFVVNQLKELKENRTEFLARGGTLSSDAQVSTDFIVGYIQGLNEFLNIEYEEPAEYGH